MNLTNRASGLSFRLTRLGLALTSAATFVVLILGVYFYIHSATFRQSMGDRLSVALGVPVEFSGELKVHSLFPNIGVSFSGVKLQTARDSDGSTRARLQNLHLTASPSVVFSAGASGNIDLEMESLSIITDSGNSGDDQYGPSDASVNVGVDSQADNQHDLVRSITEHVADLLSLTSELNVHVDVDELAVFVRDEKTGNSAYQFANVNLTTSDNDISASGDVLEEDAIKQTFTMLLTHSTQENSSDDWQVAGILDAEIAATSDRHLSHRLSTQWQMQGDRVVLAELEYKSAQTWLRGDATVEYSSPDFIIDSDLELRQMDLSAGSPQPPTSSVSSLPGRLFPFDQFTQGVPKNLAADIRLYLGAIRLYGMPVANGQLDIQLDDGIVEVTSQELYLLGGAADLSFELDNSLSQLIGFKMKLEVGDMQLERIRSRDDEDAVLSRGAADVIVAMRGAGPSPGHIASSLNGYVIAAVSKAEIKQRYSTLIDIGVVSWAMEKIAVLSSSSRDNRPSASLSDPLPIECASLRIYINDGRVEVSNGAIIETPSNVLFSSGFVDLQSEKLGFVFRTKSRSMFDLSAISIAKYAEVGGSLMNPTISLNAKELAKQGVLSASSAAWGPLPSLVYSLAESGLKNSQSMECTPDIG